MTCVSAAAAVFFAAAGVFAEEPAPYQPIVQRYQSMLQAVTSGSRSPSRSIERLFGVVKELEDVLLLQPGAALDTMADDEYERVRRDLPGVIVERDPGGGGMAGVLPDGDWFLRLARARGDAADRAFFTAYHRTYPTSAWPAYAQQQTDEAGCTDFGSGQLVALYAVWTDFERGYPRRYLPRASNIREDLEREITTSTCACGDAASVERELDAFVRRFPTSAASAAARERLRDLRANRSTIRLGCVPG